VHETTVAAGSELRFNYRNHSETVYCIEGEGSIEDVAGERFFPIAPGTLYSVGIGEDHILRIQKDTRFLCILEPALEGQEEAD
jgi:L-ectoine synthase